MKQSKLVLMQAGLASLALGAAARAQTAEAPPVCINGGPYLAECTGPITLVPLDGTASFDPDGTPVTFFWFDECPFGSFEDPTDPQTNFIMDNTGVCVRVCTIVLRVTSGGQMTPCLTTVTVQDTTAPVISCPSDVVEVWTVGPAGGQTDPSLTGTATAVDCDPAPVIGFSDVLDPGDEPGEPETIVTRTWTATDFCLNQSSCVQTITLLSPGNAFNLKLDLMPGVCPNQLNSNGDGLLQVVLFGTSSFDVNTIDKTSLVLQRKDNVGGTIQRMNVKTKDRGRPTTAQNVNCQCGSASPDGRLDLQITLNYAEMFNTFQLAAEAPGATNQVALTGRFLDGRFFTLTECTQMP